MTANTRLPARRDPEGTMQAAQLVRDEPERVDPDAFARALSDVGEVADQQGRDQWRRVLDAVDEAARAVSEAHGTEVRR